MVGTSIHHVIQIILRLIAILLSQPVVWDYNVNHHALWNSCCSPLWKIGLKTGGLNADRTMLLSREHTEDNTIQILFWGNLWPDRKTFWYKLVNYWTLANVRESYKWDSKVDLLDIVLEIS